MLSPNTTRNIIGLTFISSLLVKDSDAFSVKYRSSSSKSPKIPSLKSQDVAVAEEPNPAKLTFQSAFAAESSPVPATSPEQAVAFFRVPEHLSFGDSTPSHIVTATPDLVDQWQKACDRVGASLPNLDQDVILSVRTAGVSIPGLTVEWSAYIGSTMVQKADKSMLPEMEFVLIKDDSEARGIKPVMWIYEKLTTSNTKNKSQRETRFFSRLGLEETDEEGLYMFRCQGTMEIQFRIPAVVLKALGNDKAKSERRMSKIITSQIEKDMAKALAKWQATYKTWIFSR